jgi:hypothetical protein
MPDYCNQSEQAQTNPTAKYNDGTFDSMVARKLEAEKRAHYATGVPTQGCSAVPLGGYNQIKQEWKDQEFTPDVVVSLRNRASNLEMQKRQIDEKLSIIKALLGVFTD